MSLRNSCGMLQANAWLLMAAKISKRAAEMCMGIVLNFCQYGVPYLGSYYNTGPYIHFPHFGNSNRESSAWKNQSGEFCCRICSERSSWKLMWLDSELHSDSTPSSWVALQLQHAIEGIIQVAIVSVPISPRRHMVRTNSQRRRHVTPKTRIGRCHRTSCAPIEAQHDGP